MLLAFAVALLTILLLDFKVVVRAIVVEDTVVAFPEKAAVFVGFRLNQIGVFGKHAQSAVNIV